MIVTVTVARPPGVISTVIASWPVTAIPSVAPRSWVWVFPSTMSTTCTGLTAVIATWTVGPAVAWAPPGIGARRRGRAASEDPGSEEGDDDHSDRDEEPPARVVAAKGKQVRVRGLFPLWRARGRRREGRRRRPEVLVELHQHAVRVQAEVGRVRAEEAADVDVALERLVALPLEGLEVLRPDAGLPAGLLDGFPLPETSLPQNGSDAGPLHYRAFRVPWRSGAGRFYRPP